MKVTPEPIQADTPRQVLRQAIKDLSEVVDAHKSQLRATPELSKLAEYLFYIIGFLEGIATHLPDETNNN